MKHLSIFVAFAILMLMASAVSAENMPIVKSKVVDVAGQPVEGAFIFFYDSPDTRRAVDLVSPVTDKDGYSVKEIPPGMYWALARLKKEGDFDMGPLMIGDKVSSDPIEVDVKHGDTLSLDFTIMNLLDTVNASTKKRQDLNRITGTIVDENGEVPARAFVFANRHDQPVTMPAYFSAWADKQGRFTIYLPSGSYYLGVTETFTPKQQYAADTTLIVDSDAENVVMVKGAVKK